MNFIFINKIYSSHQAGGEITYKCLGGTVYEITLVIFQDCKNGTPSAIEDDNPANLTIYGKSNFTTPIKKISLNSSGSTDVPLNISSNCIVNIPLMCMKQTVFKTTVTLTNDPNGYLIAYQRCCRNQMITNIQNPSQIGTTLYSEIPAPSYQNNSPQILNYPPLIICINNPFEYNYQAIDLDGDSLSYSLCDSYAGSDSKDSKPTEVPPPPYPTVHYVNGYSSLYPIKSSPPMTINAINGHLSLHPTQTGIFIVTVCISEYRNGVLLAVHRREFEFFVTDCSRKVYAEIPQLSSEEGVHQIECKSYTVNFVNNSQGGTTYFWDFGDPTTTSDTSSLFQPSYTYPSEGTYNVKLYVDRDMDCSDSTSKYVKVYPFINADFEFYGTLCPDSPITFLDKSTATFGNINNIKWDFGDGSIGTGSPITHDFPNQTKNFEIKQMITSTYGCVDTSIEIIPLEAVICFAGNDTTVVKEIPIIFNAKGSTTNWWTPNLYLDNDSIVPPTAIFPKSGTYVYVLHSINESGCSATDTVTYYVSDKSYLFIPNAFTPNGDGKNDVVKILPSGIKSLNYFRIYNRYGQIVFYTISLNDTWDGTFEEKTLDTGVYYWTSEAIDYRGQTVFLKGNITLIR